MDTGPAEVVQRLANAWQWEHGPERNAEAALREYKVAEQLGSAYAANRIGMIVLEGQTVAADAFHAVNWFRHAATCGSAEGLHNLGSCYEMGMGIVCDTQLAEFFMRRRQQLGAQTPSSSSPVCTCRCSVVPLCNQGHVCEA
jgi:TPR repeat protein